MHPKEILMSLEAGARKSLSQNFLVSPHWAATIVRIGLEEPADEIWEIGPGLGALTQVILEKAKVPVRLFEYDKKFAEYLRKKFPSVQVAEGDFLEQGIIEIVGEIAGNKKVVVVSNLPYHISSKIFFHLATIRPSLVRMVLTFQKEFAERLVAVPRTKAYSSLSIMGQSLFKMDSLGTIPAKAFYPAPTVASEAVLFTPSPFEEKFVKPLERVLRVSFQFRRKKLINNLKRAFPPNDVDAAFSNMKLSENCRPEELTKEKFMALTSLLMYKNPG